MLSRQCRSGAQRRLNRRITLFGNIRYSPSSVERIVYRRLISIGIGILSLSRIEGLPSWSLSVLKDAVFPEYAFPLLEVPAWLVDRLRLAVAPRSSFLWVRRPDTSLWSWALSALLRFGWAPALGVTVLLYGTIRNPVPFSMAVVTDHRAFLPFTSPFFSFRGII